jgi:hypothetical protein
MSEAPRESDLINNKLRDELNLMITLNEKNEHRIEELEKENKRNINKMIFLNNRNRRREMGLF